jgi:hypothetical protein
MTRIKLKGLKETLLEQPQLRPFEQTAPLERKIALKGGIRGRLVLRDMGVEDKHVEIPCKPVQ